MRLTKNIDNFLAWCAQVRDKHARHNDVVVTRQVVRRRGFEIAMAKINENYGGEPRKARRGIARTIARREWSKRVAA